MSEPVVESSPEAAPVLAVQQVVHDGDMFGGAPERLAEDLEAAGVDIAAERDRFLAANPQFSGARVDVRRLVDGGLLVQCHGW